MQSCYKNIFKIRKITFIYTNFENSCSKTFEKIKKIHEDSKNPINSFIRYKKNRLADYLWEN